MNNDINDIFDSIVTCEDLSNKEGYDEGLTKGKEDGRYEGFHLGYHRGAEIGAEIGFIYGVTKILIYLGEQHLLQCTTRAKSSLQCTLKLIQEYPQDNDESIDLSSSLDNIRCSYKKSLSHLKLKCEYPQKDHINF